MSSYEIRGYIWAATVLAVCAVSARRGGPDDRLAAGGLLAGWAMTMLVYRSQFREPEWGILIVDAALLGLLVWIALRSTHYWPIFAAAFHLLAVVTHVARVVDHGVGAWAYITAEIFWGYLLAFSIAYGAWNAQRYRAATPDAAGATRR